MNILILGNGFDLAHHLPTCYDDFLGFAQRLLYVYTWHRDLSGYVKTHIDTWENGSEYLKDQLKKIFSRRTFSQRTLEGSCLYTSVCRVNENVDKFHEVLVNNIWFHYFLNISATSSVSEEKLISGENWIDFESEISFVIQNLDNEFKSLDEWILIEEVISQYNSKINKDTRKNLEYINNRRLVEFYKTCKDKYIKVIKVVENQNVVTLRNLRDRLYDDLENLILAFEFYLTEFVDKIPFEKLSFVEEIEPECVISFNYTQTFERLYFVQSPDLLQICHVHGECTESENFPEESDIVIGIDEYLETPKEQSRRTNFAIFKKFIQRIRKRNSLEYITWTREIEDHYNNNKEPSSVYIFGHSLNVTDKEILEPILKSEATYLHIYARSKASEGSLISNLLMLIGRDAVIRKSAEGKIVFERIEES